MIRAYLNLIFRARWILGVIFLALFALSVNAAKNLKLKSDVKELLPESFQSVRDLNKIIERFGGTGSLIVAIESDDREASIRFAENLVSKINQYPREMIKRIEYNALKTKSFILDHKYLYMELEDLLEIERRIERKIEEEKLKKTGIYLEFDQPENSSIESSFEDIKKKYQSKTSQYEYYYKGYFFDETQKLMAIVIQPPGSAVGLEFTKKLVSQVQSDIDQLNPTSYHPSLKVSLGGHYRRVLFEYQTLKNDIVSTAGLCILLVGLAVLLYFRRVRMVVLMAWATFNGTFWTFAITAWKIGYLTSQTAFLGSIIIGNGINYGLILMARYLEERRLGKTPREALEISVPATLDGTLASSVTTSVSFGVLMMSNIKGFSQFGFIGGLGMLLCWVATYTVLPVFLLITEEVLPVLKENVDSSSQKRKRLFYYPLSEKFSQKLPNWSRSLVIVGVLMTLVAIPLMLHFAPNSLEYNFNKLRMKAAADDSILNDRIKKIFGGSVTPAVLVTDRTEDVTPVCREIMRKNELDPPEKRVIESCKSLYSYLPQDQDQKIEVLTRIQKLIEKNTFDFLSEDQKQKLRDFQKNLSMKPIHFEELPETIVSNFRERNGDVGKVIYIYSTDKVPLWDGKNLIHFSDIIRQNKLPSGEVVTSSGDSAIFADILRAVAHDGPRATGWAFLAVCLVIVVLFREWKGCFYILGTLVIGIVWMGGLQALFDIKVNFFNFIAIPTTFGIGIDYGCNVYQRYRLEGKGSLPNVIKTTGGAVLLCSITTIIGYLTLVIASNQALVSFGWIAIIGEVTCLLSALVFVPAAVILIEKRRQTTNEC